MRTHSLPSTVVAMTVEAGVVQVAVDSQGARTTVGPSHHNNRLLGKEGIFPLFPFLHVHIGFLAPSLLDAAARQEHEKKVKAMLDDLRAAVRTQKGLLAELASTIAERLALSWSASIRRGVSPLFAFLG